jgi:hypothetical protein
LAALKYWVESTSSADLFEVVSERLIATPHRDGAVLDAMLKFLDAPDELLVGQLWGLSLAGHRRED